MSSCSLNWHILLLLSDDDFHDRCIESWGVDLLSLIAFCLNGIADLLQNGHFFCVVVQACHHLRVLPRRVIV